MIRTSKKPFPFPLPWNKDQVFMIRAGDVIERDELDAELDEAGAGDVFSFQLNEAFSAGVVALLGSDDAAEQILNALAAETDKQELSAEDQALLDASRDAVRRAWPAYGSLLKQNALRSRLAPTLAFSKFVTGWQGDGLPPFAIGPDGLVLPDLMAQIDRSALRIVGMNCYRLLFTGGEEGNSAPPLPSDKSPAPSKSDKPAKGGSSRPRSKASQKSSGTKTRSSSSRAASSPRSTSGSAAVSTGQ